MTCEYVMNAIEEACGKNTLSRLVRFHLWTCPRCAYMAKLFEDSYAELQTGFIPMAPDSEDIIMAAVREEVKKKVRPISELKWIGIGLIVLAASILPSFGNTLKWLGDLYTTGILLPLYLTIGGLVTVYCVFFIASHLEVLSKRFKIEQGV